MESIYSLMSNNGHTYIISGFSRGSRGATGTHGALVVKRKQAKVRHSFQSGPTEGDIMHFTSLSLYNQQDRHMTLIVPSAVQVSGASVINFIIHANLLKGIANQHDHDSITILNHSGFQWEDIEREQDLQERRGQ